MTIRLLGMIDVVGHYYFCKLLIDFFCVAGRGRHSHAYTHSVQLGHRVYLNLHTLKVSFSAYFAAFGVIKCVFGAIHPTPPSSLCMLGLHRHFWFTYANRKTASSHIYNFLSNASTHAHWLQSRNSDFQLTSVNKKCLRLLSSLLRTWVRNWLFFPNSSIACQTTMK